MQNGKNLLIVAWVLAVVAVAVLGVTLKRESGHFYGITENLEQSISFPYPVEIEQALVVDGQEVKTGTLMLRLNRADLQAEIEVLKHQIAEKLAHHHETVVTLQGQINALQQDKKLRLSRLDTEISELRRQQKLNMKLLHSISGDEAAGKSAGASPMQAKLAGLQQQRLHVIEAAQSQIDSIQDQLAAVNAPEQIGVAELEARLAELSRQQARLVVKARYHGRVGSLLFRVGDQVPAFQPVLTLHSLAPKLVKGYIHEEVYNRVSMGQKVWLHSLAGNHAEPIEGVVESLGARIVPYPERLLKNPTVSAWGREVVVRLEENNPLLLGERVLVDLERPVDLGQRIAGWLDFLHHDESAEKGLAADAIDSTMNGLASLIDAEAALSKESQSVTEKK